jgi:2-polyprenyl-3-methyl-5-hydroxy-6-metoxy-1,4-benzoquinol methylase
MINQKKLKDKINSNENKECRICYSEDVKEHNYDHPIFSGKKKEWKNYYCSECSALSHYLFDQKSQDYINDYRIPPGYDIETKPPIDPWSQVTFDRGVQIATLLKKLDYSLIGKTIDIGGYNGFLSLALKKRFDTEITVADFDKNGLTIASAFGLNVLDLSVEEINYTDFDNYLLVHVLEHLERPSEMIKKITDSMTENSILYIEVPNIYGFPFKDPAHLTSFSMQALLLLIFKSGLEVIRSDFISTPNSSFKFGYFYQNKQETIYLLCKKTKKVSKEKFKNVPIDEFTKNLDRSFNKIGLVTMAPRLLRESAKYFILFVIVMISSIFSFSKIRILMVYMKQNYDFRHSKWKKNE